MNSLTFQEVKSGNAYKYIAMSLWNCSRGKICKSTRNKTNYFVASSFSKIFISLSSFSLLYFGAFGSDVRAAETSSSPLDTKILDNTGRGSLPTPPVLKGPLPPNTQGLPTPKSISAPETPAAKMASDKLDKLVEDTIQSMGALFVDPDKVIVQPPMLTALITLDDRMSPYQLDGAGTRSITLNDVASSAVGQNLDIKVIGSISDIRRWNMWEKAGAFLPNILNESTYQGFTGNYASPGGIALRLQNYFWNPTSEFQWYLYRGGGVLHTYLQKRHDWKASKWASSFTTNDVLLNAVKEYYQLAENDVLLQIKIKSVEAGSGLLLINEDLYANGVNTMMEVLQAKTQLSRDRQELIKQQIARRQSAIKLSTTLNQNAAIDLTPANRQVVKLRLIDKSMNINDLIRVAIDNRPELKRFEEMRLAAKEEIKAAKAPLLPQIYASAAAVGTFARIASVNNIDNQQLPFSSSGGGSTNITGTGGGGLPLGSNGSSSSGRHKAGRSLFILGVDMQWQIGGLGVTDVSKIQSARANARRIQLEFLSELNKVCQQVRDSYLSIIQAENLILETSDAVNSSKEQLRVAKDRLTNGVGTNLDVIDAERSFTRALIDKAKAIIEFNTAEAQLLHDIGRISPSTVIASRPLKE